MKNDVTEMLDLEFPIFAFLHCRDVAAAVSKAGGLGVLGALGHTPDALEVDLEWIEDEIGDRPYGVDLSSRRSTPATRTAATRLTTSSR